ncbi:glycoside hydrolase family 2 TIM barrel-domain containing protein [Blautia hominis]|uniref:Glycoside hydrolase family 2 TIM barrel-domain containing protein n=1 Tax=Blautia hominis TaxID=2025493 RepID=A0ABQ0BDG9_9FIRM
MIRRKWNDNWVMTKADESPLMAAMGGVSEQNVLTLPHDAMIHEKRTKDTKNGHQTGFYPGGCYTYTKMFDAPVEWQNKDIYVEFEGVYEHAKVYINGSYAGGHPYGYTEFSVCANDYLNYGRQNMLQVIANNSGEENSRWYSGSGIYRNVNLHVGEPVHIAVNGIRVSTPEIDEEIAVATVKVELVSIASVRKKVTLETVIKDQNGDVVGKDSMPVTLFARTKEQVFARIGVEHPKLWSVEEPNLYTVEVYVKEGGDKLDEGKEPFGFRCLSLTAQKGLRINGKNVNLRGACIHHDNGIIGAATYERAEERRIQILKKAGFNCVRSSHHPISRALLDACDREGMLVIDELFDCWTKAKNNNDYSMDMSDYWEKDAKQMVAKDYNHPCVIMYISGNEIQEAATARGAQMCREITNKLHELDGTRYVTTAINGLLACMDRMGDIICDITGMTMEQMIAMQSQPPEPEEASSAQGGVDQANGNTDFMKGPMADAFATNHIVTEMLEEFADITDLTGYNYLTARHEMEHTLSPNRIVLGTETLPSDLVRLWKIVRENAHVIGDMTWTGWDYLGEAGSGCIYYDGRQGFMSNWPISVAGMGDIDILGNRRPISYFREIVFGLRKEPYIAVERLEHYGEMPSHSAWPWKDELESWTWKGYEGKPCVVNVYSDAEMVELFLNGTSFGKKPAGEPEDFYASFELMYEPGTLTAVNYRNKKEAERWNLTSASNEVTLCAEADRRSIIADGSDLVYIMISLKDEKGTKNLQMQKTIDISVSGEGTLIGVGNADPGTENHYDYPIWDTYDGYLLAVVRATNTPGTITVIAASEGMGSQKIEIKTEAR